jgi:hypothetical protein
MLEGTEGTMRDVGSHVRSFGDVVGDVDMAKAVNSKAE